MRRREWKVVDKMMKTTTTASVRRPADRAAIRAEVHATQASFHALVKAISPERWSQPWPGSAWTACEVMVHLTWALEQLPSEVASARRGRGMFNYPAWIANPGSYWINRWSARGQTPASVLRRYDAAIDAALVSLNSVADDEWERGASFYGHGFYTIEGLFHTPAEHLDEHTAALAGDRAA